MTYPWPGWASYGPPPGETSPVVKLVMLLMLICMIRLWWLVIIRPALPALRRIRWPARRPPLTPAPDPAPATGHTLRFEYSEPAVIVIDNSDPRSPPRPGRYAFDWDE